MNDYLNEQEKPHIEFLALQSQFFNKDEQDEQKECLSLRRRNIRLQMINPKPKSSIPIEDTVNHIKMRQKFQILYRKIRQMSKEQTSKVKPQTRFLISPIQQISEKKLSLISYVSSQEMKSQRKKQKSQKSNSILHQKPTYQKQTKILQINTVAKQLTNKQMENGLKLVLRKTRYRTNRLAPIKKQSYSNSIKDYLSIERINIKDLQAAIVYNKKQDTIFIPKKQSNLLVKEKIIPQYVQSLSPTKQYRKKKFVPPFETYYYRDLLWRVGFSNQRIVETPQQYQPKIKVFLGKGNNSRLVKGILNRRPWYSFTDKIQQANFAWTQLKIMYYIELQKKVQQPLEQKLILYKKQSIFTMQEHKIFEQYWKEHSSHQCKIKQDMNIRNKIFKIKLAKIQNISNLKIHNHFKNNYIIGNKKALFHTMEKYYKMVGQNIFQNLPLTFHIKNGLQDDQYLNFLKYYYKENKKIKAQGYSKTYNVWIVKPGQFTNRGNGIIVCLTLQQIKNIIKSKQKHPDGTPKTFIVQKYIQKPFLYKRRKFDLRHYIMISCLNGVTKGYWYKEGYVRTTSSQYTLKLSNGNIHLTNDAVQKSLPQYGKYQKGNKISYQQLDMYIKKTKNNISFWDQIYPKMKKIATDIIRASGRLLDSDKKTTFQIFGLDFMIDEKFDVWVIEVNTNPCLELSCPLLGQIIPRMLQNVFELCLDSIFPPTIGFNPKNQIFKRNLLLQNGFQLVYDQRQFIQTIINPSQLQLIVDEKLDDDQDDVFEDDGQDWNDD